MSHSSNNELRSPWLVCAYLTVTRTKWFDMVYDIIMMTMSVSGLVMVYLDWLASPLAPTSLRLIGGLVCAFAFTMFTGKWAAEVAYWRWQERCDAVETAKLVRELQKFIVDEATARPGKPVDLAKYFDKE